MIARISALAALCGLLTGCMTTGGPASIAGGECKIFERPAYAVRGRSGYDQRWIDETVEGGVSGCGWQRPGARPASLDAQTVARAQNAGPAKRSGVIRRAVARVKTATPWPAKPLDPAPTAIIEPRQDPAPQLPPRSDLDDLLDPSPPRSGGR